MRPISLHAFDGKHEKYGAPVSVPLCEQFPWLPVSAQTLPQSSRFRLAPNPARQSQLARLRLTRLRAESDYALGVLMSRPYLAPILPHNGARLTSQRGRRCALDAECGAFGIFRAVFRAFHAHLP